MTTPKLAEDVKGRGRHYRHPATGELVPSVTNVISVLNKPALPRWAASEVAKTAWNLRHSLDAMGEADAVQVLKGSPWRKSGRAAERGTDIHAYLESRINGYEPEPLSGEALVFKSAADAWFDYYAPEAIETELTVFGPDYAGTGDLWCTVGDEVWLLDFKTSKAIYPEAALQLAALWAATLTADGEPAPNTPDAQAWVVRIGADKFEMKQVRDLHANYAAFRSALSLWHWQHENPYGE